VSYGDLQDGYLKYAVWTGTAWSVVNVELVGGDLMPTQLQLDNQNHPHIVYMGAGGLRYATWTGQTWSFQVIADPKNLGGIAFVVGHNNQPQVLYTDDGLIRYAFQSHGTWHTQPVINGHLNYTPIALALDSHDVPHIALVSKPNSQSMVTYGQLVHGLWQFEDIAPVLYTMDIALALDSTDQPQLAFGDTTPLGDNPTIRYAQRTGAAWNTTVIGSAYPLLIQLSLDRSGIPNLVYYDQLPATITGDDILRYARRVNSTWDQGVVGQPGQVGWHVSFRLDRQDVAHISYVALGRGLVYATRTP
jgi:hypothetical protein